MPEARDDPGRHETEEERSDRNLTDLLQELRVAGLGVQVLFGFLLSLPFTSRFSDLDGHRRALYVASLLLSALSTALLTAPVAYHRMVFRQHQKEQLLLTANVLVLLGLGSVGCAITAAVILVISVVDHGIAVELNDGRGAAPPRVVFGSDDPW
jgi:MFS family permease